MFCVLGHAAVNDLIAKICEENKEFSLLLQYIHNEQFMKAKFHLANMNKLQSTNLTYDFFGEETIFTKHICFLVEYEMISVCTSHYCPHKELFQSNTTIPTVSLQQGSSVNTFRETVVNWLFNSWSAPCNRRLVDPLPPDEFINWGKNTLT